MIKLSKEQVQNIVNGMLELMGVKDFPAHVSVGELVTAYRAVIEQIHPERSTAYMKGVSHIPGVILRELAEVGLTYPVTHKVKKDKDSYATSPVKKETVRVPAAAIAIPVVVEPQVPVEDWSVAKLMAVLVDKLVEEKLTSYTQRFERMVEERVKEALGSAINKMDKAQSLVYLPKHNPEPTQAPRKEKYKVLVVGAIDSQTRIIQEAIGPRCDINFITTNAHKGLKKRLSFAKYDLITIWVSKVSHSLSEICVNAEQPHILSSGGLVTLCNDTCNALGITG